MSEKVPNSVIPKTFIGAEHRSPGVVTFCDEQSGLNRLAEGAYSDNGDNRPMRLRC